jgi:hypothetical protein
MRLVWQWGELERNLPPDWAEVQLVLTISERDADRAAALLGNLNPLRHGNTIRLFVARTGNFGPHALRRGLLRLDRDGIDGKLELAGATAADVQSEDESARTTLADVWTAALLTLPDDWSDLYAELTLRSSDHLEHAALLSAPLNPLRAGNTLSLRFRVARWFGYGASPGMVRRCLARLDEEGMPGTLEIIHGLSDTHNVGTQGPVWRIGGRSV